MNEGDKGSRKLTSRDFLEPCLVFLQPEMSFDAWALFHPRPCYLHVRKVRVKECTYLYAASHSYLSGTIPCGGNSITEIMRAGVAGW